MGNAIRLGNFDWNRALWLAVYSVFLVCVSGLALYRNVFDLFIYRPVRVPAKGEIIHRGWLVLVSLAATLAVLSFGFNITFWLIWLGAPLGFTWEYAIPIAWIPCALLLLALFAYFQSLRRKKSAVWLLLLLVLCSALAGFWYDISHERYQMSVDFATKEYWDNGGRRYLYLNWPFYTGR